MIPNILHSDPARAQVNGVEIVYDTFGDPDDYPMLLIMGLGNQMIGWREEFCKQLADRGYWIIRFDNRDAGLSARFDHLGTPSLLALVWDYLRGKPIEAPYTLRDMAGDAVGLLDALSIESAHVVGASLGGMIAQMLGIYYPRRVRTLTSMMSSTNHPRLPPPRPRTLILFRSAPQDRAGYIERAVKVRRALRGDGFPFDQADVREHAARLYDRSPDSTGIARQMAAIIASARSRRKGLRSINVPTLVIHGSADPLMPVQHGIHTARLIPGAELLIIKGLGHELPPAVWPQVIGAIAGHACKNDASAPLSR